MNRAAVATASTPAWPPWPSRRPDLSRGIAALSSVTCAPGLELTSCLDTARFFLSLGPPPASSVEFVAPAAPKPPSAAVCHSVGAQEPDATVDDDYYYSGGAYYYMQLAGDDRE
ncbi:uncharacterized protein [Triticum aestivum]|uniref:uncharacterized protein n=1 Tax=Triticum aestivum TaxID=4565 RepID=UPI001D030459|nr:uncharacterized protein LOC123082250 [Triticum aestivum]